jgi:beta-lactamase regulating signal transducer with metallopeptidase domain
MTSTLSQMAIAIGSSTLWSLLLKTTVAAALGLGVASALRHGRASLRHAVLASTLAVMLALPVIVSVVPTLAVPVPVPSATPSAPSSGEIAPATARPSGTEGATRDGASQIGPTSTRASTARLVVVGWAAGTAFLLIPLAAALVEMRRLRRTAVPWLEGRALVDALAREAGILRQVTLVIHEEIPAPLTCGVRTPTILLPEEAPTWTSGELRRAVVHELEHVRRRDWWVQLLARTACATYWFNPLVWIVSRQLALEAERACDDAVIANEESTHYAEQLVTLARRLSARDRQPVLAMANRSDLARRVSALLDSQQARGRAGTPRIALVAGIAVVVGLAVAPVRVVGAITSSVIESAAGDQSTVGPRLRPAPWSRRAPSRGDRALVEAAEQGDVEELKWLLDAGANVNAAVDGDGSALIVAAREGHFDAVSFLLDRNADPNLGVGGDGNALIMAAREGHLRVVELLLARGASIEEVVPGDENALIQASSAGRLEVVKLLVARGANVNARVWSDGSSRRDGEWRTPLNQARRGGHREVEAYLRSVGAVE